MAKTILLAAGGTGGHLFPAHALASEMKRRGWIIHLVSDDRIDRFASDFPADEKHLVPSATPSGKSPIQLAKAFIKLGSGYLAARKLVSKVKPDVTIGFGGYPTVPPILAAATKYVPTLVHEQNAVMGRANKFLAARVRGIAMSFAKTGYAEDYSSKTIHVGNPVRDAVLEAAKTEYDKPQPGGEFRFTIFGGSQGAAFFSKTIPAAIAALPEDYRARLRIVQQARPEDKMAVQSAYDAMAVKADVESFFDDMPKRIAESHLLMCRSGASTAAELAVIGRPAILVPYPHALDHDQRANAAQLSENGGCWIKEQNDITVDWVTSELKRLMDAGDELAKVAANAKVQGRPDAVQLLANMVELTAIKAPLDQTAVEGYTAHNS